jgi:hypothetical protein
MTNQHPITPPPELVEQLRSSPDTWLKQITNAYQAGADQELEACCEWFTTKFGLEVAADIADLRAARRPKPPSLNSIALQMLGTIERDAHYIPEITDTIRRALEALDD